jgi:hypothetical protein
MKTFYQPLFTHSFPVSNFPLEIFFPSKSFLHHKAKSKMQIPKAKGPKAKAKSKSKKPKAKAQDKKQKPPLPPSGAPL